MLLERAELSERASRQAMRVGVPAARAPQDDHAESARDVVIDLRGITGRVARVAHRGRVTPAGHLDAQPITEVERRERGHRDPVPQPERGEAHDTVRTEAELQGNEL